MFNNKFNSSKKDPLVEAVQNAMQDGDLRRQAIAYVNEQFGVFSRNAVVNEHKAAYDAALEEAYKSIKEGKPLTPAQDRELDVHDDDKIDAKDFAKLRAMRKGKRMDEKKDCYEEGTAEAETSMNVTSGNKPSTPAQTSAADTGLSKSDRAGLTSTIKSIKESIARKKDIAKGGATAPIEYADKMGFANPGAISKLDEAWNKLKEARKCMEEESDTFDSTHLDEAYANYIAEAINEYGLQEEHPIVTAENLYMFNEAYIAAVLGEAAKHEKEKAEDHEEKAKELDEARMRAEKECNEEKEEKEEHDEDTKKRKVLAKTLKHIARKKAMAEELQIDEISKKTYVNAVRSKLDWDDDRAGDASKIIDRAQKHHGDKFAKDLEGVVKDRNRTYGRDKLADKTPVRVTKSGMANKSDLAYRKRSMRKEELQIDEVSAFGQAFRAAGGKNFSFGGKTYSGARADGKASTPAASTPGTQGVATGKSFSAIDKAQAAKAKSGPADNPGLRGASPAMPKTPGTVARDTGITGKPGGETGVTSGSTVSLDRQGNAGASPSAPAAPAPKPTPAPTTATSGSTPAGAKPTTSSGLVGPDAGKMATPSAPTPTTSQPGAPKDDASASVKKLMSMNESVQVGDNKYRIV